MGNSVLDKAFWPFDLFIGRGFFSAEFAVFKFLWFFEIETHTHLSLAGGSQLAENEQPKCGKCDISGGEHLLR